MNENLSPPGDGEEAPVELPKARVISGFWRRILALIVDVIVIGIVGLILGSMLFDQFARLGVWGRLVGLIITLIYLGILNSSIGRGQTIGKRIANIKVVDRDGEFLSVQKSFLRSAVLEIPFFLNGALIPPSVMTNAVGILLGLIIFGASGAIIYLYIFNRATRQSLHDLLVGSFVVRASSVEPVAAIGIWKPHLAVIGGWCLAVVIFSVVVSSAIQRVGPIAELLQLQNGIMNSGKVHMASVFVGTNYGPQGEIHYLRTNAIWRNKPDSPEKAASEIASIMLRVQPEMNKDVLAITISYGFDIGIATAWQSYNESHSPAEWQQKLQ